MLIRSNGRSGLHRGCYRERYREDYRERCRESYISGGTRRRRHSRAALRVPAEDVFAPHALEHGRRHRAGVSTLLLKVAVLPAELGANVALQFIATE